MTALADSASEPHADLAPSPWIQRWSPLLKPHSRVLDLACGSGRHMRWLTQLGHEVLGLDRSAVALALAAQYGEVLQADIENDPWPLQDTQEAHGVRTFDAVLVTNYLWRPLLNQVVASVASGGLLLYETFSQGNETVGKPSRPDFLLQPGELLKVCRDLRVVSYECGFLTAPDRHVQRIAAARPAPPEAAAGPVRYRLG